MSLHLVQNMEKCYFLDIAAAKFSTFECMLLGYSYQLWALPCNTIKYGDIYGKIV